jgi:hypothetical protein
MQAMNDLLAKYEPPGQERIHVQGIGVAGEFSEGELIV